MENKNLSIHEFIKKYTGNIWDICTYFYLNYIKDQDNETAISNLTIFLVNSEDSDESFPIEELYPKEEYDAILTEVYRFINSLVSNLVKSNPDERDFYSSLLTKIKDDTIFESDAKKGIAIMSLILNLKIPYFKLSEGLKISDEDFTNIIKNNLLTVKKSLFIVNAGLEQNTETASLLLKLIESQSDDTTKTVILANVLSFFNYRYTKLQKNLTQENSDKN